MSGYSFTNFEVRMTLFWKSCHVAYGPENYVHLYNLQTEFELAMPFRLWDHL